MDTLILFKADEKSEGPESIPSTSEPPPPSKSYIKKITFDINKWVNIMKKEIEYLIDQAHVLLELKERLNLSYEAMEKMNKIANENVEIRKTRPSEPEIPDGINENLLKEAAIFEGLKDELNGRMVLVNEQLERLRTIRIEIETEVTKREEAKQNEHCARLLNRMKSELGEKVVPQVSLGDPAEWLVKVSDLIKKSREERKNALFILPSAHGAIVVAANKGFAVWNKTNALLRTNIQSDNDTKTSAEKTYNQVIKEIRILSTYLKDLKHGIKKKSVPLGKAEANLEKRQLLSGSELCSDSVTLKLLKLIHFLKLGIEALQERADEVEGALAELKKQKRSIGKEIQLVMKALFIDQVKCLQNRQLNPPPTFYDLRFQLASKPRLSDRMVR